jgi:hypothetical protein
MKKQPPDAQLIGIAGQNWLVSQLIQCGIEVAMPVRDKGIDLIAYVETQGFRACRIQIKVSRGSAFKVYREGYSGMLMVYIWHIYDPQKTVAFAMKTAEARRIVKANKWDENPCWTKEGGYWRVPRVAQESYFYRRYLHDHKMDLDKWRPTILRASSDSRRKRRR